MAGRMTCGVSSPLRWRVRALNCSMKRSLFCLSVCLPFGTPSNDNGRYFPVHSDAVCSVLNRSTKKRSFLYFFPLAAAANTPTTTTMTMMMMTAKTTDDDARTHTRTYAHSERPAISADSVGDVLQQLFEQHFHVGVLADVLTEQRLQHLAVGPVQRGQAHEQA